MRRSLCVLAASLLACATLAAPAPEPFISGWGSPIDPDKDCKISRAGNALTIEMPGNDHDYDPIRKRFNAPRLLRDMEGDFKIQVRVQIDFLSSSKSTVKGQPSYISAGFLLIYPETGRCICDRFEYGISQPGIGLGSYALAPKLGWRQLDSESRKGIGEDGYAIMKNWDCKLLQFNNTWDRESPKLSHMLWDRGWDAWPTWPMPKKTNTVYLQLELQERWFRFLISADGKWYTEVIKRSGPPTKFKFGLAAFSTSSRPSKVRFDQLKLTRGKKKEHRGEENKDHAGQPIKGP
ncbi:MAG TPA: hypothetical protein VH592_01540 [Gemmataceae bacterium]|jgi:regulation of enolase protein 1 (concanavalin A-like superfamily)